MPNSFSGRVIVVQERANPSADYFVLPRLRAHSRSVELATQARLPRDEELVGSSIVFVRYVPREWMDIVARNRRHLAGVAYFMDDDLFDLSASAATPLKYRIKIARLATSRRSWLQRMDAELWVSTPYLAGKYADDDPVLIPPNPLSGVTGESGNVRVFYHGSASHRGEIAWLAPVIAETLRKAPNVSFEIIGDAAVNRLYRTLPRTTVVHPMSWESYLHFCEAGERHIGLAPLLQGKFNAGRSHTKFFDILRCGAAGIYSDLPPFSDFVRHGRDGILVKNERDDWVEAILHLARNPMERNRIVALAKQHEPERQHVA
jgi:glycosyltransferase involved in cell wall biosynthesis